MANEIPADPVAWRAVESRDRRFDGRFIYAVQSTGIFCRPSCPSRRPRRKNVRFFASPADAERAGFRACLRCRPKMERGTPSEQAVERARAYIEAHLDETVTLDALAEEAGLSPHHLQRTFKELIGLSPRAYQNARRMEAFKEEVGDGKHVLEATFDAGFGSSRALYEQAEAGLGMTPATYRRGGKGVSIHYTILATDFGQLLVAATDRGVCAVSLSDDEADLLDELRREFPNAASISRNPDMLQTWAGPVVRYLEGVHAHPTVPLDVQGSDFQRRVWKTLQDIPYGETRTYGEVAEMLGSPGSARAVARACATNKVALVIPCHRVVRSDGSTTGFRWGPERKRQLLQKEKGNAHRAGEAT